MDIQSKVDILVLRLIDFELNKSMTIKYSQSLHLLALDLLNFSEHNIFFINI